MPILKRSSAILTFGLKLCVSFRIHVRETQSHDLSYSPCMLFFLYVKKREDERRKTAEPSSMSASGTPGSVASTHSNPDSVIDGQSTQKTGDPISVPDSKTPGSMPSTPLNFAMAHDHAVPRGNNVIKKVCKVNQDIYTICNKSEEDGKRVYPYHCCVFCGKLVKRIATHLLTHKDQKVVSRLYTLKGMPASDDVDDEIKMLHIELTNKGDHQHNMKVLEEKRGQLLISRRDDQFDSTLYAPCQGCFQWYKRATLTKSHNCPITGSKPSRKQVVAADVIIGNIPVAASKDLQNKVLAKILAWLGGHTLNFE